MVKEQPLSYPAAMKLKSHSKIFIKPNIANMWYKEKIKVYDELNENQWLKLKR